MSVAATNYVWERSPAEGADRLVLLALADFADESGNCFGSWGKLEQKTRLARRTIADCLRRLQKSGELVMMQRGTRKIAGTGAQATIWSIPGVETMGADAAPKSGRWVQEMHLSGADAAPKWCNPCTPTYKNIKERRDSETPPVASLLPASDSIPLPPKRRERKPHPVLRHDLGDEAWLAHVKTLPQYAHVNFDALLERCIAWCASKGEGAPSRMRLIKWADKEQKPLTIGAKRSSEAADRRRQRMLDEELAMKAAFAAAEKEAA